MPVGDVSLQVFVISDDDLYLTDSRRSSGKDSAGEGLLGGWGGGVGGAQDEHVGRVVAEGDAILFEGEDDASAQFAEDAVSLIGTDADLDRVGDGAAVDFVDAKNDRVGDGDVLERGVVADVVGDFAEQGDDLVWIRAGVDTDIECGDRVVAGQVGDGGDLAIGNDVEGTVGVAETGAPEGEVFDGALETGEQNDFANVVLILNKDEDAVEHVFEDGLRAETDTDADDAGGRQDGLVRDVKDIEQLKERNETKDAVGGSAQNRGHGAELGGAVEVTNLPVGSSPHLFYEEENYALKDEDDEENNEDLRQLGGGEGDDIIVPIAFHDLQDVSVLRGRGQKEHD
jgi:hypothetical protein